MGIAVILSIICCVWGSFLAVAKIAIQGGGGLTLKPTLHIPIIVFWLVKVMLRSQLRKIERRGSYIAVLGRLLEGCG